MLGLPFKIGFERPIVWTSVVGQIVGFAHFVSKLQNQRIIFSSIAALPFEFGNFSKIGLGFKGSFQELGESEHQGVVVLVGGRCDFAM
jgi:hypothetical protein